MREPGVGVAVLEERRVDEFNEDASLRSFV